MLGRFLSPRNGRTRTSTLHVDASVDAYLRALETEIASGLYHIASEVEPAIREIADAVAVAVGGVPAISVDYEEAVAALDPFTASFLTVNNRLDASRLRDELSWHEGGYPLLLDDVATRS